MLIAIVAGVGVLAGVLAIAVDMGRAYVLKEQVVRGARATVYAIAEDCLNGVQCDSLDMLRTLADANAAHSAAGGSGPTQFLAWAMCGKLAAEDVGPVCWGRDPDTGATLTASEALAVVNARCPAIESSVDTYVRLVVRSTATYASIFGNSAPTHYAGCSQAQWHRPRASILLPTIWPACNSDLSHKGTWNWPTLGQPFMIMEDNGTNQNRVTVDACVVQWVQDTTQNTTLASGLASLATITGAPCGQLTPTPVELFTTRAVGTKLKNSCSGADKTNLLNAWDQWIASGSQMMALGGPVTGNGTAPVVKVIAFAPFTLLDYSYGGVWDQKAAGTTGGKFPRDAAARAWLASHANTCDDAAHICVWGKFASGSEALFAGSPAAQRWIKVLS